MTLSQLIKTKRSELGMSLEEFGEMLSVSRATVQRWECGNIKSLKWQTAVRLAAVLGISPLELADLEETRTEVLKKDEGKLIDVYRKLPAKAKETLIVTANALLQYSRDDERRV